MAIGLPFKLFFKKKKIVFLKNNSDPEKFCDIFTYGDISMEPNEGKDIREYYNHV